MHTKLSIFDENARRVFLQFGFHLPVHTCEVLQHEKEDMDFSKCLSQNKFCIANPSTNHRISNTTVENQRKQRKGHGY